MTAKEYATQIISELGEQWLPLIYRERIRILRTRAYQFGKLSPTTLITLQHTLLGVELKVGRRRFLCPDLATARYLQVFARAGCNDVAIPYDITKVSQLADELESSWYRMLLLVDDQAAEAGERLKARIRGLLVARVRLEIATSGSGPAIPEFKQSTKQDPGRLA